MSAFTRRFSGNKMGFDLLPYLRVEFLFPALALCFVPLLMLWQLEGGTCRGNQLYSKLLLGKVAEHKFFGVTGLGLQL